MLSALLFTVALLHPVHETVSEVEWNRDTQRLEVAVRFDALDEAWLKKNAGGKDETHKWRIDYLRRRFRVTDKPKKTGASKTDSATYHWIGRDDKGSHVWWYFEIGPADATRPRWIDQQMLFEHNENHLNRILVLGHLPRRAFTLTIQRPRASLDHVDEERNTQPNLNR